MDTCLLCLQLQKDKNGQGMNVNSMEWVEENVEKIIEKHFWPMKSLTFQSWLCMRCWRTLHDFHKFHEAIEEANSFLLITQVKTETSAIVDTENEAYLDSAKCEAVNTQEDMQQIELAFPVEEIIETKNIFELKSSNAKRSSGAEEQLADFISAETELKTRLYHQEQNDLLTSSILQSELHALPEEDNKYGKTDDQNTAKASPNESDHMVETAIDQVVNKMYVNENELLPLEEKLELSSADAVVVEEVTVPLKRSCRLKGRDPLKKAENKKSKISKKIKKKRKTPAIAEAEEKYASANESDYQVGDNDSLHSDDYKMTFNYNYKPSAKHKEEDKFVAENFKIVCGICQVPLPTFYEVSAHSAKEHSKRGFVRCCNKKFYRRIILVEHLRWHIDPERFKCKICGKVLANRRCLQAHERLHAQQDRNNVCDICGKGFARPATLRRHKYTHIPEQERKIPCEQCEKRFANNVLLREHVRSVHLHSYSVVVVCDICGKELRSKVVFNRHMLRHAGLQSTVSCDICGLKLTDKWRLKFHKQTLHSEEGKKEYKCHICFKISASRGALKQHVQYNHETGYDFKCTFCDKAFKRASTLKEHMATHTGTVLYTCPYCPKTFNSNANMYTHRKKAHPQKWEEAFREKYSGNLPPKLQKEFGDTTLAESPN